MPKKHENFGFGYYALFEIFMVTYRKISFEFCASSHGSLQMFICYFLPITWLNLRRSAVQVAKWIGKLGSGISKMWTIFAPG